MFSYNVKKINRECATLKTKKKIHKIANTWQDVAVYQFC